MHNKVQRHVRMEIKKVFNWVAYGTTFCAGVNTNIGNVAGMGKEKKKKSCL